MTVNSTSRLSLLTCLPLFVWACAGDPAGPDGESTNFYFQPPAGALEVEPFTDVFFRAVHATEGEVEADFYLDGELVYRGAHYLYSATLPGEQSLRAEVSLGEESRVARWRLQIVEEVSAPVPVASGLDLEPSPVPGEVYATWEGPPGSQARVPIDRFLLHYSHEPFFELPDEEVESFEVPPDPTRIVQSAVLRELTEGALVYVRVQVRDVLGRVSGLSAPVTEWVTASFSIQGKAMALDIPSLSWSELPDALVSWRGHTTSSGADGSYELSGLSAFYQAELLAAHPSGSYHGLRTLVLQSHTQAVQLHFFPLQDYAIRMGEGDPEPVDFSRLVRIFTRTETGTTGAAKSIYHWESYPVQVFVPEFVHVGNSGEAVDYRAIFLVAIESWNAAAGAPMLAVTEDGANAGVTYDTTLGGPNAPLGEVVIEDPPDGSVFESPPRRMLVRLREFNTIALAERIITHELGHVLLLGHSPDPDHCMNALAPHDTPTEFEGWMSRVLASLPQGLDMNFYR